MRWQLPNAYKNNSSIVLWLVSRYTGWQWDGIEGQNLAGGSLASSVHRISVLRRARCLGFIPRQREKVRTEPEASRNCPGACAARIRGGLVRHEPRITGTCESEFSGASLAHGVVGRHRLMGVESLEKRKDITSAPAAERVTVNESLKPFDDKAMGVIATDLFFALPNNRCARLARLLSSSTRSLAMTEEKTPLESSALVLRCSGRTTAVTARV